MRLSPSSSQIICPQCNFVIYPFESQCHCSSAQFSPSATQPLILNILLPKFPLWLLKLSMEGLAFYCIVAIHSDFFQSFNADTLPFSFSHSSCIVCVWIWTWGKLSIAGWSAEIPKSLGLWFDPALYLSSWGGYPICSQTKQVSM